MLTRCYSSGQRFPHAWRVGNLLFTSGQVALGSDGTIIGVGDIEMQTRVAFDNLRCVLRAAGCDTQDLIKLTTYLVFDGPEEGFAAYWNKMATVRQTFMSGEGPTATAVRVVGFSTPGLLIEIDGIAVVRDATA